MESVVIVAKSDFGSEVWKKTQELGRVSQDVDGNIVLESGSGSLYFGKNEFVCNELEEERLTHILELFPDPTFFTVDYHDIDLCRKFLSLVANQEDVLVDNDFGTILPGNAFVKLIASRPGWDWRVSP